MLPRITDAVYEDGFTIHIRFSDCTEGDVDFEQELDGEIFKPLREISYFKNFTFNEELHAITWHNGADFAPEFLYEKLKVLT